MADDDRTSGGEKRPEHDSPGSGPGVDKVHLEPGKGDRVDKDPDQKQRAAEQDRPEAPGGEDRGDPSTDVGEGAFRSAHNTYHFYGSVNADSATFGLSGGRSGRRRSTGRIPDH